jgi:hypothetical protein
MVRFSIFSVMVYEVEKTKCSMNARCKTKKTGTLACLSYIFQKVALHHLLIRGTGFALRLPFHDHHPLELQTHHLEGALWVLHLVGDKINLR